MVDYLESATVTKSLSETIRVERGKPHERETQIMVGESFSKEMNEEKDRLS